mgnify:CR=1 FL=1
MDESEISSKAVTRTMSTDTDTGKVLTEKALVMASATLGGFFAGTFAEPGMTQKVFGFVGGLAGGAAAKGWYRAASGQSYFTAQFVADHLAPTNACSSCISRAEPDRRSGPISDRRFPRRLASVRWECDRISCRNSRSSCTDF